MANLSWVNRIHKGFQSSSGLTPEFQDFFTATKCWFRAFAKKNGFTNLDFHRGHFEFSGFMTASNGQVWYFSSGDVRWNIMDSLLIRTAKDYKDYTGGRNQFSPYRADFETSLKEILGIK